jgi:hypothetical protein
MTTTADERDSLFPLEQLPSKSDENEGEEPPVITEYADNRERLPWIGALPNPRVGPMVALNEGGYLVPLCTAGDLLRVCRYLWR